MIMIISVEKLNCLDWYNISYLFILYMYNVKLWHTCNLGGWIVFWLKLLQHGIGFSLNYFFWLACQQLSLYEKHISCIVHHCCTFLYLKGFPSSVVCSTEEPLLSCDSLDPWWCGGIGHLWYRLLYILYFTIVHIFFAWS